MHLSRWVVKGGEIDPDDLRFRLLNADHLAYIVDNGLIVATGAIKNPTLRHKNDIARRSKIDLSLYQKELGYISVEPSYQRHHLASRITENLLTLIAEPIFATSRVDNAGIHKILSRHRFTIQGNNWFSQVRAPSRKGTRLCLWTRPKI